MTAPERPGAVFDCMVFLQAAARPTGPAAACLRLVETGAIPLFVSADILREVEDVLSRPTVRRKNPRLTDQVLREFLERLAQSARRVESVPASFAFPRDPKDEPYLNLAITAPAKYLVSWDNDLLDLMGDNPEGTAFRNRFPGLVILTPVAFLRQLTPPPAPAPDSEGPE